jgi:tetratricopeptide (TPR) repeat protein
LEVGGRISVLSDQYPGIAIGHMISSGEADFQESELNENVDAEADLVEGTGAANGRAESVELLMAATQYVEAGEWSNAQECITQAIRIDPENGTAYQQRVWVLLELGKFAEALQDAEVAVCMEPDDSESYRARGAAYIKAGHFERAVVDLTRYIDEEDLGTASGTRASRGYYLRGLAYAGLGNFQKAVKDYSRAIRQWPDWPEPYEARAEAYEIIGNSELARADRDQARRRATP